ncbi:hypothetical protein GCM10011349_47390 [Novosphingobium indicum]|uniref:Uncharacterized protein n=1 Tax=Novosphingobium indicum TaxID=462949 RepID=A0ABQ2K3U2_9SPHN|nr:hypothetical protein [Novosphingobium indicum]GGN63109.1 hypothetical protein GCM10011349_47390 [Novosphingobium indicum]
MTNFIDRAADLLFPAEGRQTLNIKFFGAAEGHMSAEDMAEQIVRAEAQIREGNSTLVDDVDADLT